MPTKADVQKHQRAFLDKAKARVEPITTMIEGCEVVVNPGVFPPATDTKLLATHAKIKAQNKFIDVTTGSGVVAVIAGLEGASGFAIDINAAAVKNAEENLTRYKLDSVHALESDLFSNVPDGLFDVVFANGPFFEGEIVDPMDYACYGARAFIEKLFSQIKDRLSKNGRLLIVVSQWAELDHLEKTAKENGLMAEVIDQRKSDDGERNYLLYEIKKQN